MSYTKPEIAVLGDAIRMIEPIHIKPWTVVIDVVITLPKLSVAYDLDE